MHCVKFLSDEEMPEGHDFIFVQVAAGAVFALRESALSPAVLEDAWGAYRAARRYPPVEPTAAPTGEPAHLSRPSKYWREFAHLVA